MRLKPKYKNLFIELCNLVHIARREFYATNTHLCIIYYIVLCVLLYKFIVWLNFGFIWTQLWNFPVVWSQTLLIAEQFGSKTLMKDIQVRGFCAQSLNCSKEPDSWGLLSSWFPLFRKSYHRCPHYYGVVLLKQLGCFHLKHSHLQFWSNNSDNFLFSGVKKNTENVLCETCVFSQHGASKNPAWL